MLFFFLSSLFLEFGEMLSTHIEHTFIIYFIQAPPLCSHTQHLISKEFLSCFFFAIDYCVWIWSIPVNFLFIEHVGSQWSLNVVRWMIFQRNIFFIITLFVVAVCFRSGTLIFFLSIYFFFSLCLNLSVHTIARSHQR